MAFGKINFFKKKNFGYGPSTGAKAGGAGASALVLALVLLINPWEGDELKPYPDVGGVPTACGGVTGDVITKAYNEGRVFTQPECDALTFTAAASHERGLREAITDKVEADIPNLTMAAWISFTYNVGVGAVEKSTLIRLVNQHKFLEACEQLPRWTKVKGVTYRGLENRRFRGDAERLSERTVCLIGLDESYKTPLFDKLIMKVKR